MLDKMTSYLVQLALWCNWLFGAIKRVCKKADSKKNKVPSILYQFLKQAMLHLLKKVVFQYR